MAGEVVIVTYRPRPGREGEMLDLVRRHVPRLRKEGLATKRPVLLLKSLQGSALVEIFEWADPKAADRAHENPRVMEIWGKMAEAAEFGPISEIAEGKVPFPHFAPLDGVVT